MRTSVFLPVGVLGKFETILINKGDILKLATGETVTFLEMKRTKFIAEDNVTKGSYQIPIWRMNLTTPFIVSKTGETNKVVIAKRVKKTNLKYGDIFSLEGKKETYMFLENITKRTGKSVMKSIDLSSQRIYLIGEGFSINKVDLAKIKKENKVTA